MSDLRLSRVFWIGAAAILIVAALIAMAAILRSEFGETDAKVLGTLLVLLVSGGTVISALALIERGELVRVGWTTAALGTLCFALIAAAIWDEFDNETLGRWAGTAIAVLIGLLLVTTQRLLLRVPAFAALLVGTALAAGIAAFATAYSIWSEDNGSWELAAIFWVFAALGFLLLPVLQRFTAAGVPQSAVRVLASLGDVELVATRGREGTIDASLAPGERLVLRRRS